MAYGERDAIHIADYVSGKCYEFNPWAAPGDFDYHAECRKAKRHRKQAKARRKKGPAHTPPKRQQVYMRDGFRCVECRQHLEDLPTGEYLTLDHIVPRCKGGDNSYGNLQTMCRTCNNAKADSLPVS